MSNKCCIMNYNLRNNGLQSFTFCTVLSLFPRPFSSRRKNNNNIIQKLVDYELYKESLSQVMRDFQIRIGTSL